MATNPIGGDAAPVTLSGTTLHMPAVARRIGADASHVAGAFDGNQAELAKAVGLKVKP